jgi:hypothetical protein
MLSSMPTPSNLSWDVMHTLQAAKLANDLPDFISFIPTKVDRVDDYAGKYQAVGHNLSLIAEGDHLFLDLGETRVPLEKLRPDTFLIPHPDFDIFPLVFLRDDTNHIPIKGCNHGSTFYVREGKTIPEKTRHPSEWETFVGHYRSWNPWLSNFRIVLRNGDLILVHPDGEEYPLIPKGYRSFRVGDDELSPEYISFNQILTDQALQANLSGVNYYRFFTP